MNRYARRRLISNGIVAVAALAFGLFMWRNVQFLDHPYDAGVRITPELRDRELAACRFPVVPPEAAGFVDALASGRRQYAPTAALAVPPGRIDIIGWTLDPDPPRLADGVIATVDGRCDVAAAIGINRPDVGTALKNAALSPAGFLIVIPAAELGTGAHTIEVTVIDRSRHVRHRLGVPLQMRVAR